MLLLIAAVGAIVLAGRNASDAGTSYERRADERDAAAQDREEAVA